MKTYRNNVEVCISTALNSLDLTLVFHTQSKEAWIIRKSLISCNHVPRGECEKLKIFIRGVVPVDGAIMKNRGL